MPEQENPTQIKPALMFAAMVLGLRCGLEAMDANGRPGALLRWTIATLGLGGFLFGPLLQIIRVPDFNAALELAVELASDPLQRKSIIRHDFVHQ